MVSKGGGDVSGMEIHSSDFTVARRAACCAVPLDHIPFLCR